MKAPHCQVAVVGSGFAGSLTAMVARQLGLSTVLIERARHPRFAIGESSTPLANLLLEEIADEYRLPFVRPLSKWGSWQRQLPHLACGLKRGFTFYKHEFGRAFAPDPRRERQLLVGASPNERIADTHWYRPDFDKYLVEQAQRLGVTYWEETRLTEAREEADGLRLAGSRGGEPIGLTAEFVIDATGPRGFLHHALNLPEQPLAGYPPTQALYSHFREVAPLPAAFSSGTEAPPYPPEQAAVHHVFPGGWVWVLKFNNGVTSAGVAANDAVANDLGFADGEAGWRRLLARLPPLAEIFGPARAMIPFVHSPRLPFQSATVAGPRWALLPYAAGFVDPLLSTGFPLALLGVSRIGRMLRNDWRRPSFAAGLAEYGRLTALELAAIVRLVGALYATMNQFDLFRELSLLYFAAATYSETVRRLGRPQLADSFLLFRHPVFGPELQAICAQASQPLAPHQTGPLSERIRNAIAPLDVAGLSDPSRQAWYPAQTAALFASAAKVGASREDIAAMLENCGWRADEPQCRQSH